MSADFPILDADRPNANAELGRFVTQGFGFICTHIDEIDNTCAMGLRLAHDQCSGWHLELGPYDIDADGIEQLRAAIAAYDRAVGR